MSQVHLQGGRVDISLVESAARNSLLSLLEKCSGSKIIVWGDSLEGPIGCIVKSKQVEDLGMKTMYPLRKTPLPERNVDHVIFITKPKLSSLDMVADNVLHDSKTEYGRNKQYHLFLVPRISLLCQERLKHRRMLGSLTTIEELNCEMFPFESDLISLEIPEMFGEYFIQNDPTSLYQIARALVKLQIFYGPIARIWGKGQAAKQVWTLVEKLIKENNLQETFKNNQRPSIDQILLIDRSIDLVTPLVTQLTYEGLIDEIYGIETRTASFPPEKFTKNEELLTESLKESQKKFLLNSEDKLFANLRDKHFNAVGPHLSKTAHLISAQMEDGQKKRAVQELKLFVQKLPQLITDKQALSQHTAIAEYIKEVTNGFVFLDYLQTGQEFLNCIDLDRANAHVEQMIARKASLVDVLRLICLQSLCASGLKQKLFEYYKREIVQVYGVQSLVALSNLEQVGLIKLQSGNRPYVVLRKLLNLTVEDTSETDPTDISYAYSGYAPLSVRIVEQLIKNDGWKQLQDVLGLLPGPTFEQSQSCHGNGGGGGSFGAANNGNASASDAPASILVMFIGGCTYAEISALRFLSQQLKTNVEFLIVTTRIINGKTFLSSIINVNPIK